MNAQTFYIAKSGYKGAIILAIAFVVSALFSLEVLTFVFFMFLLFWLWMFRNPERLATHLSSNAFLSPSDGRVEEIYAEGDHSVVVVNVGVFDVGVLRSPAYIDQYELSSTQGVPLLLSQKRDIFSPWFILKFGSHSIEMAQYLFDIAPIDFKSRFGRGERMGFLKAGKIKIKIKNIELKIGVGDKIKGGESIIGYLK